MAFNMRAVYTWHPFGHPRAFCGFSDDYGHVYLVLDVEQRAALTRDLPDARRWPAYEIRGPQGARQNRVAFGKLEDSRSGKDLALMIPRPEMAVEPFRGTGDQQQPRPGLTWGSAMLLDAARKVAAADKISLLSSERETVA